MHIFLLVAVVLGMSDSRARRGELNFSTFEVFQIAHAVFVFEFAVDNVGPDEEFGVRVGAKAGALFYAVFVDHAEGAEGLVAGVVVGGEGEGVEGVQPAMVSVASLMAWTLDNLERVVGGRRHVALNCWC